jgi:hypothetical protein
MNVPGAGPARPEKVGAEIEIRPQWNSPPNRKDATTGEIGVSTQGNPNPAKIRSAAFAPATPNPCHAAAKSKPPCPQHETSPRLRSPCVLRGSFPRSPACTRRFAGLCWTHHFSCVWAFARLTMQRLTARFVLLLLLVSMFAPAALAISQSSTSGCCCARKCCIRKHRHPTATPSGPQIQSRDRCYNNCRCSLVVPNWAEPSLAALAGASAPSALLASESPSTNQRHGSPRSLSTRGPPPFSIA